MRRDDSSPHYDEDDDDQRSLMRSDLRSPLCDSNVVQRLSMAKWRSH